MIKTWIFWIVRLLISEFKGNLCHFLEVFGCGVNITRMWDVCNYKEKIMVVVVKSLYIAMNILDRIETRIRCTFF